MDERKPWFDINRCEDPGVAGIDNLAHTDSCHIVAAPNFWRSVPFHWAGIHTAYNSSVQCFLLRMAIDVDSDRMD